MVDIQNIASKIEPFMDDKESILVVQEIIKEMVLEDDSEVPNKMVGLLMKFGFGPSDGIANFGGYEVHNFKTGQDEMRIKLNLSDEREVYLWVENGAIQASLPMD